MKRTMHKKLRFIGQVVAMTALLAIPGTAMAGGDEVVHIERQDWSFGGMFGTYDRAQLRRGYQVYTEVCASCHSLDLLAYRNLSQKGGPEFSEKEVKAFAADVEVQDGPNSDGEMYDRPGKASDRFKAPYANTVEARSSNNGALPPDLSVITKARGIHGNYWWFQAPFVWLGDILAAYQEGGADYLYALLTGYVDPPKFAKSTDDLFARLAPGADDAKAQECVTVKNNKCVALSDGMSFNTAFPGHQIGMPNPLSDEAVEYADGTKATLSNHARDVTAFLMWTAEPHLEARKSMGLRVLLYLAVLAGLLYMVKRRIWSNVEH